MKYQDTIKKLEERISEGKPTPFYDERPMLFQDLETTWLAFWRLGKSRGTDIAGNMSPISIIDMIEYRKAFLPYYDLGDFVDLIQSLDNAFMDFRKNKGSIND